MAGYFVGIDMGGTTTKATAIDRDGKRLTSTLMEIPTGEPNGAAHVVQQMKTAAEMAFKPANATWKDVLGVTLATPGPAIDGVLGKCSNLPHLHGADLRGGLQQVIAAAGQDVRVNWVNDANAGTYADWVTFGEPHHRGVIGLYPGTGLGAGYVTPEGYLLVGEHGAGAELGHLPMPHWLMCDEVSTMCGCGREGCVETAASIVGLRKQLAAALKTPQFSSHPLASDPAPIEKKVLSLRTLAQKGDELALHLFARQARVLAATLVMAQIAYDAGVAVLGGGLTEPAATTPQFRKWFVDEVTREFHKRSFDPQHLIQVVVTLLGDMAQAVGAAELARNSAVAKI
jgi:predicted NBD/HSP70 family sugar kinase